DTLVRGSIRTSPKEVDMYLNTNVDETRPFNTLTTGYWHIVRGKAQQAWGVLTSDIVDLF
ncbi:MAG: hypothetical protein L0H63_15270, partial [Nitrococcus sp.]|nr:hypothetical protein [Nitrococcus sp.]